MSRNVLSFALAPLLAPVLVMTGTATLAQQAATAEDALAAAGSAYGPPAPVVECDPGDGEEIVVCAKEEEQSQFRVRSDKQAQDDYARETMYKGDPQAPDVAGPGIFRGPATIGGMCIPGLQKCPRPPAIEVDLAALPAAPPGSDADRMARGLPPIGNDEGDAEEPAPAPAPER